MSLRLIIVEDDACVALWLHDILTDAGHVVVGMAIDADEALRTAATAKSDIVIMDVGLARGADGVNTAKLLRDLHDLPVLFVSGGLTDDVREKAHATRPLGYVSKPFTRDHLLSALLRLEQVPDASGVAA